MNEVRYEGLSIEVASLQREMGEVKSQVGQLSGKIDGAVNDLGTEMRRAIDALGANINERAKTPWAVIWPGLGVIITLLIFIGNQALSPILLDIKDVKSQIVTRTEHEARWIANDIRQSRDEAALAVVQNQRYAEMQKAHDRLLDELKESNQSHLRDMQDQINKGFARDHDQLVKSNEDLRLDNRQLRGLKP